MELVLEKVAAAEESALGRVADTRDFCRGNLGSDGKIVLRRVAGFDRDQLLDRSIVKFLDFRGRNSPFRANPWEPCDPMG